MYALTLGLFVFLYLFVKPVVAYIYDAKGLRKYPNFYLLSGQERVSFPEALRGSQETPCATHGPNALSYSDHRAIKDIYGHGTACIKDRFYSETSGSHSNLADFVDKSDHARKRKMLSSAYALKNLEEWEFKVADVSRKLIKAFDARCTDPLPPTQLPKKEDLTVDYRNWTVLFTATAIASIGLSEDLGFLNEGSDKVISESKDGTTKEVSFRECHAATSRASYELVCAYDWFQALKLILDLAIFRQSPF
ncbi:hypothetical protein N7539_008403 [Penicillium diatomitis]|uniref:Uncharacterized protein n=1 Tax=Penicillium diatomitis TaxID=2819901 RepID=A0A9W9WTP6_9EURO|nr:uncharacterized protein N7539_008403 [Penicillium diatomitis]KAJ5475337.1 hypothetical protein N7539_008403 [Penicillium diatomitis]